MSGCLETSWKRPNTGERVSGFGDREELEFAKPAEGTNMIIIQIGRASCRERV